MASAWEELPKEILEIIFNNLKVQYYEVDYDLRECALVCHGWVSTAQEVIFSAINLKSEDEFERLIYVIAFKPALARFVKAMHCNFHEYPSKKHIAHLAIIARYFPQLRKFDSFGFIEDVFYELFCNLVKDGKFPYLKEFPKSHNIYQDELRASCMISHGKNSITNVNLFRHDDTSRNDYRLLCDALPQFTKLHKLDFTVISVNSQNIIDYLDSTTRSRTLQEASYIFDFPDTSTLFQMNTIQPVLNMKSLTTHLWRALNVDHADYILYLMKKFPNLESFALVFHNQWRIGTLEDTLQGKGPATFVKQLFEYLSKLLDYSISFLYTDGNNVSQLFVLFFHYIRDLQKIPVHLELSSSSSDDETSVALISLIQKKGQRDISLQLHSQNHIRLVHRFLEEFGHHFEGITIERDTAVELTNDLNHISKHCTNLKSLSIGSQSTVECNDERQNCYEIHKNLKKLSVRDFSSELFPFVSSRFPCIETVKIQNWYHSDEDEYICRHGVDWDSSFTEDNENSKITRFDMKNFSFQHLVIEITVLEENLDVRLKNIYMKFVTHIDGKARFIHILAPPSPDEEYPEKRQTFVLADDPTEVGYKSSIGDVRYLHYEVKCKSVETVSIIEYPVNFDTLEIEVDILRNLQIPLGR